VDLFSTLLDPNKILKFPKWTLKKEPKFCFRVIWFRWTVTLDSWRWTGRRWPFARGRACPKCSTLSPLWDSRFRIALCICHFRWLESLRRAHVRFTGFFKIKREDVAFTTIGLPKNNNQILKIWKSESIAGKRYSRLKSEKFDNLVFSTFQWNGMYF